jgi:multimeric flavodoxin WrbA
MKVVLLVGSPKGSASTSSSLGHYLLERLGERGWEAEEIHIHKALRTVEATEAMIAAVSTADLVVLSFPTYFDSAPAAVVRAMGVLASARTGPGTKTSLVALTNCGFIEAETNQISLGICRLFARDARFTWKGGLALGGGGAINGRALEDAGGMAKNTRRALELAAAALAESKGIPQEAVDRMARPFMPAFMIRPIVNMMWKSMAKKNGVRDSMYRQP